MFPIGDWLGCGRRGLGAVARRGGRVCVREYWNTIHTYALVKSSVNQVVSVQWVCECLAKIIFVNQCGFIPCEREICRRTSCQQRRVSRPPLQNTVLSWDLFYPSAGSTEFIALSQCNSVCSLPQQLQATTPSCSAAAAVAAAAAAAATAVFGGELQAVATPTPTPAAAGTATTNSHIMNQLGTVYATKRRRRNGKR